MQPELPDPEDLSLRTLDAGTVSEVNWRQNMSGWRHWEAVHAEQSEERDVWIWPDDRDENETLFEIATGPMMNYAYELGKLSPYVGFNKNRSPSEAARLLVGLPLCIVEADFLSEEWYLALTGGGMDFSWQICEAYMRLGFIPPVEFADLPKMAGHPRDERQQKVLAACKRSFKENSDQAQRQADRLKNKFAEAA